jgi:2-amino-4-hydroxy-6-hydroxymethyldihydropteridine diphosphokinase
VRVFLGLGANLRDPQRQMEGAIARLGQPLAASSLYRTAPVGGPAGQPDYLNAVITIAWDRSPFALLTLIHQIEADFGRERLVRFGPRTLDIDIVAIDGLTIESPSLTVPHPRAHERAFVLVPLAEVSSEYATILGWDGSSRAEVMNVANFDVESSTWVP